MLLEFFRLFEKDVNFWSRNIITKGRHLMFFEKPEVHLMVEDGGNM